MTTRQIVTIAYGDLTVSIEGYAAPETIVAAVISALESAPKPEAPQLAPLRLSPDQRVDEASVGEAAPGDPAP